MTLPPFAGNPFGDYNLHVPSKVEIMIWRAVSHCLPMLCELHSRWVDVLEGCPLYHGGPEDAFHVMVQCAVVKSEKILFSKKKNGKMIISVKIRIFFKFRMTKRTSPLESSHEI